jgi:acyl carrier protein
MTENAAATQAADPEHLEGEVVRLLAQILYVEPESVDHDGSFPDLGLDSILVVEFCALLEDELGVKVSATQVYKLATPRNVARHLSGLDS